MGAFHASIRATDRRHYTCRCRVSRHGPGARQRRHDGGRHDDNLRWRPPISVAPRHQIHRCGFLRLLPSADQQRICDYGGGFSGAIDTPLGFWNGYRVTGSVNGFFTNMEGSDRTNCNGNNCVVIDPTNSSRAARPRRSLVTPNRSRCGQNLLRNDYFLVGAGHPWHRPGQ
jgi:hypothetical protein